MTTPRLLSDRYELGDTLGYGGMSEVHRGRDVRLGREVAVKVLRADLARDPQFQHRFRREAQNAAALNHPAIVAVYDTGETTSEYGPLPYIVMEYVEGRTLRDMVKTEGPLDEMHAVETMADVCAALDFSHRNGIIHRDVKPANIMINESGAVKVMDFGIARALADGQGMTQTAAVIGTAQYLSPEQARGESVDARSDVYAAGCVLYELVTGQPPFTGDSPVAVAYQHVREDPTPPSVHNPRLSGSVDAVVLKAMSKNPANRYQSAADMYSDLVRVRNGQRPLAPAVMTADERTSLLDGGPTEVIPGRHRPAREDDYDEDEEPKKSRKGLWILAGIVAAAAVLLALLLFTDLFSGGPEQRAVPNVVGQTFEAAQDTLVREGFEVDRQNVESAPEQENQVLESTPSPGTEADVGSTVVLRVGTGPATVQVPNLIGLDREQARQALEDAGLQLSANQQTQEVDDDAQVGRVLVQNPPAAQPVPRNTPVVITVGVAPPTATVPDVVGTDVDQARSNIEGADLQVAVQEVDSAEERGQVLAQDPPGGTEVDVGSTVTLTVSRGNQFVVPDLAGLTPSQAESRLRQEGWNGQLNEVEEPTDDNDEVGRVIDQDVPAGESARTDQTITVTVGSRENEGSGGIFPP